MIFGASMIYFGFSALYLNYVEENASFVDPFPSKLTVDDVLVVAVDVAVSGAEMILGASAIIFGLMLS